MLPVEVGQALRVLSVRPVVGRVLQPGVMLAVNVPSPLEKVWELAVRSSGISVPGGRRDQFGSNLGDAAEAAARQHNANHGHRGADISVRFMLSSAYGVASTSLREMDTPEALSVAM